MKVYTKTGDKGTTSLVGGERVPKTHIRLEAYGTIDELNAQLGLLLSYLNKENDRQVLLRIQNKLFNVGSYLATESDSPLLLKIPLLVEADVKKMELAIDAIQADLPPIHTFILPGGSRGSAVCHICRTVCRRAERRVLALVDAGYSVDTLVTVYLNRLSDYLFVLSRKMNREANCDDFFWNKACD